MENTVVAERHRPSPEAPQLPEEISDWDRRTYGALVSTELSEEQRAQVITPTAVYDRQDAVLAVHWHPEFVPIDLIRQRIGATFPNRTDELIIPTQHNQLMAYDGYAGVEMDCYSREFSRKVQLLIHFEASRVERADVLRGMLAYTFDYRSRQLFELIDTICEPSLEKRFREGVAKTRVDEEGIRFLRAHTRKLKRLFLERESETPPEAIRNKLLAQYIQALRAHYDDSLVDDAATLLRAVKEVVKKYFSNEYFYLTQEVLEEVRALGGGIVIPHPEQFWPILLAEYDVDGYEVWNPQSRQYTEFLIHVVSRQNKTLGRGQHRLLIFMGDDCHMGEKAKYAHLQDPEKAGREIGVQPAWDDPAIRKGLCVANADRRSVIQEYRARLGS